jgi:hypothetical protein
MYNNEMHCAETIRQCAKWSAQVERVCTCISDNALSVTHHAPRSTCVSDISHLIAPVLEEAACVIN